MRRIAVITALAATLVAATATSANAATLSPTSADFGTQAVGSVSAPRAFTLSPDLLDLTLSISTTGDFRQTNNCPATLAILTGPCTINVTFNPTAVGARTGTLSTTTLVLGGPMAALAGTATAAGAGQGGNNSAGAKTCNKKGKKKKGKKRATAAKKKGKKGKKCGKKKRGKRKKP